MAKRKKRNTGGRMAEGGADSDHRQAQIMLDVFESGREDLGWASGDRHGNRSRWRCGSCRRCNHRGRRGWGNRLGRADERAKQKSGFQENCFCKNHRLNFPAFVHRSDCQSGEVLQISQPVEFALCLTPDSALLLCNGSCLQELKVCAFRKQDN